MTWIDPQRRAKPRRRRALWLLTPLVLIVLAVGTWFVQRALPNVQSEPAPPAATALPATPISTAMAETPPEDVGPPVTAPYQPPPALSAAARAALLATPLAAPASLPFAAASLPRALLLPYTTIPERPREAIIEHVVQQGDTLESIAAQYDLLTETLAWSNNRRYIQVIYPGERVVVLPVDGVYHFVRGAQTIAEIAARYGVEPMDILDSPFNKLATGTTAQTVLSSNTRLIVPGGVGEAIVWTPTVIIKQGSGSSADGLTGATIAFYGGGGSCGAVVNPGGGAAWVRPVALGSYTWVRGYSLIHSGVDLAAAPGTPVYAANGGRVIFAGWNDYGYGYTIVLAHGPFLTLYGHLSEIHVSCRQDVGPGQLIGGVGNSGNSSGPHLHFEIRYGVASPKDPSYTIAF